MDATKLTDLLAQMPAPSKGNDKVKPVTPAGILADVDKAAVEKALAEMEAGGRDVVLQLADLLADAEPAKDSRVRHAIHAMMTRACGAGEEKRKPFATALGEAIGKERSAEPTSFLIRQLQLCGDADSPAALAKYLTNDALAAPAIAAMEAIGPTSAEALRKGLPAAKGRTRIGIVLALGSLRDTASADAIRPLIGDADAETRLAAAWSAARIGDAGAVEPLLKAPLGEGYERTKLNTACFILAENLAKAGKKADATKIYTHVRETRSDKKELYVREAAERGLAGAVGRALPAGEIHRFAKPQASPDHPHPCRAIPLIRPSQCHSPTLRPASPARLLRRSRARPALILLLSINLFNYIDRYILSAVEKPISEDFHVSKAQMGSLVFAFLVTYMIVSPIFGHLADKMGRWVLIGIGVIIWSVASGGSGLANTFWLLFATRCMIGFGEGAYGPVAPSIISDLYPVEHRGRVLAWFYAAIPVGGALGYVFGGMFATQGKWHWAFLMTLPPGLLLGILALRKKDPKLSAVISDSPPTQESKPSTKSYKELIRIPSFMLNSAGMTAMTFAVGGMAFFMPRYLAEEKGIPLETGSMVFGGISAIGGLIATLAGGMLGDKLRSRYGGAYLLVSGIGMLVGLPVFLLMLCVTNPWLLWPLLFLSVLCLFFNTGPSNTALANVTRPALRARAFGLNILMIHLFGDAISPFVIGVVADRSSLQTGFFIVCAMILVSGIFWLWGARHLAADTARAEREDDAGPPGFPVVMT